METEKQIESATKIQKYWSVLKTQAVKCKPLILVIKVLWWFYKEWPQLIEIAKLLLE